MIRAHHLSNRTPLHPRRLWLGLCGLLLFLSCSAQAVYYWDLNGATPGAGGPSPNGTWDTTTANWNSSAEGTNATQVWTGDSDTVFSAGADATGVFTVTISSTTTQYVKSMTVEEGAITFGPGKVALTGNTGNSSTAKFDVRADASASFSGTGAGYLTGTNGLNKLGDGVLWMGTDNGLCRFREL